MSTPEKINVDRVEKEPVSKFSRVICLILDIDDTFIKRGTTTGWVFWQVNKFNNFIEGRLRNLFSRGETALIKPVFLTTRPAEAIDDEISSFHPLLNIQEQATAVNPIIKRSLLPQSPIHVLNEHCFHVNSRPVICLCEQGAVKLGPTSMLDGEYDDAKSKGYGIQIAPSLRNYCDTTRKTIIRAIELAGIIGNEYIFEKGNLVNVSVTRKDGGQISPEERKDLVEKIHRQLVLTDQTKVIQQFFVDESDVAHDLDIFPPELRNRKQFASNEIFSTVKELEQKTKSGNVELLIADDKYSAVDILLQNLQVLSNNIKVIVPANANRELIAFARQYLTKAILSSYKAFEGVLAGLTTAIEYDKYIDDTEELEKLKDVKVNRKAIISIGEYAAEAVSCQHRLDWLAYEQRTIYFRNIREFYFLCINPNTRVINITKNMLLGMQFVISYDTDGKFTQVNEGLLKNIFQFLSQFRDPDADKAIPVIIFKETGYSIKARKMHSTRPASQDKSLILLTSRKEPQVVGTDLIGQNVKEPKHNYSCVGVDRSISNPKYDTMPGEPYIELFNYAIGEDIKREEKERILKSAEELGVKLE